MIKLDNVENTQKVKVLSLPETIKQKSAFQAKGLHKVYIHLLKVTFHLNIIHLQTKYKIH